MKTSKKISIIGFGNQAKAWALNLKDSGYEVHIGLRKNSPSLDVVKSFKLKTFELTEIIPTDYFVMLTPDDQHLEIFKVISQNNQNKKCIYAHGHSMVQFNLASKYPSFEHILLAPKSIASELRFRFETKQNLTAFYSLEYSTQDSFDFISELSKSIGMTNIFPTKFSEENHADLFSEQALLCSLIPYGIQETFNKLVENGFSKELAFYECFYESKLILDTIFKVGPEKFFDLISPNALIGSQKGKEVIFNENFQSSLDKLLNSIKDNSFQDEIDKTNINDLRKQVSDYWKKQVLTQTYTELKDTL